MNNKFKLKILLIILPILLISQVLLHFQNSKYYQPIYNNLDNFIYIYVENKNECFVIGRSEENVIIFTEKILLFMDL